jgi:ribosomal protein L21E
MRVVWTNHAKDRAKRRLRKAERTIPNTAVHRAVKAWELGDKIRINVGRLSSFVA